MEVLADSHTTPSVEVCQALGMHPELGLFNARATELLQYHGRNELKGLGGVSPWKILLCQLVNGLTSVLVIAI